MRAGDTGIHMPDMPVMNWQKLLEGELSDLAPHVEDSIRNGDFTIMTTATITAIAMILQQGSYGFVYVRLLEAGKTETSDLCVDGSYIHGAMIERPAATLVDATTFMNEWDKRRAWVELQCVPSYVEQQAAAFVAEALPDMDIAHNPS